MVRGPDFLNGDPKQTTSKLNLREGVGIQVTVTEREYSVTGFQPLTIGLGVTRLCLSKDSSEHINN